MGLWVHVADNIISFSLSFWVIFECFIKIHGLFCKNCNNWFSIQVYFNVLSFEEVLEEWEYWIHDKNQWFLSHCGRRLIWELYINFFICALVSCVYHVDQVIKNDFGNLPNALNIILITFSKYGFWVWVKETLPYIVQESLF